MRLDAVAHERRDGGAGAGQQADEIADDRRAQEHPLDVVELLQGRQFGARVRNLVERLGGEAGLQARQHFADAIGADHHHEKFDAVGKDRRAESEAIGAVDRIGADRRNQNADAHADERVGERALADRHHAQQAEQHDHEIFRRREAQREFRQRLGQRHHDHGRQKAAAKRCDQRPAQRLGRLALAAHGVAVPQHGHVDRLARNAEQNRGESAAIGAGDIHRGQQHDRGGDVHLVGEGQRQRDAHHQRQARQHADQQADDDADQQHRHVERRHAIDEAGGKLGEDVDHVLTTGSGSRRRCRSRDRTARCRAAAKHRRCAGTECRRRASPPRWCPRWRHERDSRRHT